jgi:hypothetical protein
MLTNGLWDKENFDIAMSWDVLFHKFLVDQSDSLRDFDPFNH